MIKLTDKQEKFAQLVVELSSQSESYRRAYDAENMTDKQIHEESCKLASNPKVARRIESIRDQVLIASMWRMTDSLEVLSSIAKDGEKDSDKVASVKAINAMYGWDKQTVDNISSDGSMSPAPKTLDDFYDDDSQA